MMVFGSYEPVEADVPDERVEQALSQIKRNARNRRIAMVAPVALMAAIFSAFVAAPQEHGGISLVPDAEASDDLVLPQVFGANGKWRFAEPIVDARPGEPSPASINAVPAAPNAPSFELAAPDTAAAGLDAVPHSTLAGTVVYGAAPDSSSSSPVSASSPPTPALGQFDSLDSADSLAESVTDDAPVDVQAPIRVETPPVVDPTTTLAPDVSAPAETATPPDNSSTDEDVAGSLLPEASGEIAVAIDEAENGPEVNPSTPQAGSTIQGTQLSSAVATIVPGLVLVQRAHVSVTVQVVDDDSSVIDWCNTRVDWGDGSITGLPSPDGNVSCAAVCELDAIPSAAGAIDTDITFTHEYTSIIDAAPRVFVATGDGCNYTLAEYQLNPFTVVPY